MVGCIEDAKLIGEWDADYPPDGWHYLGEGCERIAYISPDETVYKVELSSDGSNVDEYMNICRLKEIPMSGWRVPEATLYKINERKSIIAMEYVEGEDDVECSSWLSHDGDCDCGKRPCVGYLWEAMTHLWDISDLTHENVRVLEDGTRVVIDVTR